MVPTGTFSRMSSPSRPVRFEPSPWRPRSALYSGLKRKCTRVLWRSLDSIMTSPPRPPSPPEGPPRGTNFSRRKATHPLPPSPALTRIFASSMNISAKQIGLAAARPRFKSKLSLCLDRLNAYELAHIAAVLEFDDARDLGEKRVIFAAPD